MTFGFIRAGWMTAAAIGLALLTGCAQVKLPPPTASADNIQAFKATGMTAASVGDFTPGGGVSKSDDQGISIRSNTFASPFDNSLAKYLQQTLATELRAAGLLDPTSSTVISGRLTTSKLDAGASQGTASLGARFIVDKGGRTVFDKELSESDSWESSFIGAIAIPAAANHYTALYRRLVARLVGDEEFRKAVKP